MKPAAALYSGRKRGVGAVEGCQVGCGAGVTWQAGWKEEAGAFAKNGAQFVHEATNERALVQQVGFDLRWALEGDKWSDMVVILLMCWFAGDVASSQLLRTQFPKVQVTQVFVRSAPG